MTVNQMIAKGWEHLTAPLERASQPFRGLWPRFSDALIGMFALAVVAFVLLTQSATLARYASKPLSSNVYVELADGFLNPFRNQQLLLKSGLPVYDLKIKRLEYLKIENSVAQAKKLGFMTDDNRVWANGKFRYQGEEYDVQVRVRGDLSPHWAGPKKSWRIKFGKDKVEENGQIKKEEIPFNGKKQINLIIPSDKDYVLSYFVNSLMREQGLVTLRDQFVILRLNGIVQGLYYEVEHFDHPVFASQQRPETTVFGQNDRAMHFDQYTKYGAANASDAEYDLSTMRLMVDRDGELAMRAMQVLIDHSLNPTPENFRRARAVLDWDKYLRLRALTTLCNTNHVRFGSDNFRLYFDPSRGMFEPIPWDLHLGRMPKEPGTIDFWNSHGPDELQRATLMDPELRLQRNKILWELVADGGKGLMAKYDAIHNKIRPLAWSDVLATPIQGHKMDQRRNDFEFNVRRVHKVLSLSIANLIYKLEANDRAALEVTAADFSGIKMQKIDLADAAVFSGKYRLYEDANDNGKLDASDPLLSETSSAGGTIHFALEKYVLPKVEYKGGFIKPDSGNPNAQEQYWEYFNTLTGRKRFFLTGKLTAAKRDPLEWTAPEIKVAAANAVNGEAMGSAALNQADPPPLNVVGITAYDASDVFDLDAPTRSLTEFLKEYPQFRASHEHPGAAELGGHVTISGTVIVPKAVPLILRPGTDMTMMPSASIMAYGGLTSVGTPQQRIHIHDNGKKEPWGVFAVVRPPKKVVVRYTNIQGGGQAQINATLFTGGFAVHNGDLDIEHCEIFDMMSEDGMNLKNGRIWMKDNVIRGGDSDAVDLDFVTGEVRDNVFLNNKGDGLDLSGSKVLIEGNRFEGMGDKGISVGEDSHPIIVNNLIRNNQIGIATKDLSRARVAYTTFVGNTLAIEAKRKKPMFGGGGGEFVNNVFSGNKKLLSEDYFSKGLVTMKSSWVDAEMPGCAGCQKTTVRFRAPEKEDYRLIPAGQNGNGFALATVEWAAKPVESAGVMPELPGIVTPSPVASPRPR